MIVIEDLNHIGITVSNLDKAIEFYSELFDFEVAERMSNSSQAFIKVGDIIVGLYELEGYTNQEDTRGHISFYIDEEDFDDAVEEIQERDIPIVFGPDNQGKGQSVVFLDPDGNRIELCYPRLSL